MGCQIPSKNRSSSNLWNSIRKPCGLTVHSVILVRQNLLVSTLWQPDKMMPIAHHVRFAEVALLSALRSPWLPDLPTKLPRPELLIVPFSILEIVHFYFSAGWS